MAGLKGAVVGAALGLLSCADGPVTAAKSLTSEAVAREAVTALAGDELDGRNNGTAGGLAARAWLGRWLNAHGLVPAGDGGTYEQAFPGGANLIGLLPAADGTVDRPAVILAAHYDGLGSDCRTRREATSRVCNGATDNAGGVAAVLAAVTELRGQVQAPIAVVLWDREEDGLLGSQHFVQRPTFSRAGLRLLVNLDIVGLNLFRGLESHHFLVGAETGGTTLGEDLQAAVQSTALQTGRLSYALGHRRSDMTSFLAADWRLPFVFFSDGDGSVYHTDADEVGFANVGKIAAVGQAVARLTLTASQRPQAYRWQAPMAVGANYLPVRSDAATLADLLERLEALAARNELGADERRLLAETRGAMATIAAGSGDALSLEHAVAVGRAAQTVLSLSRALPFVP